MTVVQKKTKSDYNDELTKTCSIILILFSFSFQPETLHNIRQKHT